MIISPFNPIFFLKGRKLQGRESPYIQTFSKTDSIMFQIIRTSDESAATITLVNAETGEDFKNYAPANTYSLGDDEYADIYDISPYTEGYYFLVVGDDESETFRVTRQDNLLEDTVVIQYSMSDNKRRRDVFGQTKSGTDFYFVIRMPGGFKDDGWNFSVENDQFVTQFSDIVELYARESTQETLTIGHSEGVPIWFGDFLNRLLTCKYVYIDGQRYVRFESSVPEKEQTIEGVNSFVFTQKLQKNNYINPTK